MRLMQDALSEHVNMGACLGSASVIDSIWETEGEEVDIDKCSIGAWKVLYQQAAEYW